MPHLSLRFSKRHNFIVQTCIEASFWNVLILLALSPSFRISFVVTATWLPFKWKRQPKKFYKPETNTSHKFYFLGKFYATSHNKFNSMKENQRKYMNCSFSKVKLLEANHSAWFLERLIDENKYELMLSISCIHSKECMYVRT